MTSAWAYGLNILQNNCTFLNEKVKEAGEKFNLVGIDYCSLEEFTPVNLAFALRYINFTGYTGKIYFTDTILERAVKPQYLYSINTSLFDANLAGVFTMDYYQINESNIAFIDGKVPISGKQKILLNGS